MERIYGFFQEALLHVLGLESMTRKLGRWDTRWNKGVDAGGIPLEFEDLPYLPLVVYVGAFP
jgi:hypothetical protein